MALNWHTERINLYKFASDDTTDPCTASTTYYGSEADYKRRVLAAKFYSDTAITGDTSNHYDIGIYAGSTKIAELALHTSTDHTANDYTDLTLESANSTDTTAVISADVTLTCGCVKTGSATNLSTNSWVEVVLAPVEIF